MGRRCERNREPRLRSGDSLAVDTFVRQKTLEIQQRRDEHLAFIMHDLKTPLAAMETARILLHLPKNVQTGTVRNMPELIERNAARVEALWKVATQEQYNIAFSTSHEMRLERRELDLWPLVEGLLHDLKPLAENHRFALSTRFQ